MPWWVADRGQTLDRESVRVRLPSSSCVAPNAMAGCALIVLGKTECRRTLSIAKTIPDALWVTISTERGAGIESLENESPNARVLLLP